MTRLPPEVEDMYEEQQRSARSREWRWRALLLAGQLVEVREEDPKIRYLVNRELRVVPSGWQHPQDAAGKPIPLLPEQMPAAGTGETAIAAYETTSEGTPLSPCFPDTPEGRLALVRYCAEHVTTFGEHRADGEAWAVILFGGSAVVAPDGAVEAVVAPRVGTRAEVDGVARP